MNRDREAATGSHVPGSLPPRVPDVAPERSWSSADREHGAAPPVAAPSREGADRPLADGASSQCSGRSREIVAFLALAAAVRLLVAWRTVMPARDGATYLWMAERVAAGDLGGAFTTVFHPLYPLLTGGLSALVPDLPSMAAGQLVACGAAALAVWPLYALTADRFGRGAARATATLYAFGLWFARYPAECFSEGCFYLLLAVWARALLGPRVRPALAGTAAALAYAVRPEGLALLVLALLRLRGSHRIVAAAFGGLLAACLPLGWAVLGDGPTWTPKAAFNLDLGVGGAPSPVRHYLAHALAVPGTAFEAVGYLALPLAAAGAWLAWRRGGGAREALPWLLAPFIVQLLVVPMLRSHARFLSGPGLLLLPLAGTALAALLARRSLRGRALVWTLIILPDVVRLPAARGSDRLVERRLGEWLRPRLRAGEAIVTDMPRLEFFAGQRPGPPRPIPRTELIAAAQRPNVRFVAVVEGRSGVDAADLLHLGLQELSLPEPISALAMQRDLLVYGRQ